MQKKYYSDIRIDKIVTVLNFYWFLFENKKSFPVSSELNGNKKKL